MAFFPYIKIILRGISQVMLQNNALTGLLFLAGILYNSPSMAAGAFIGVLTSTATAYVLKYDKNDIEKGLYGFNGALVGVALALFFRFGVLMVFLIAAGAAASSVLMWLLKKRIPPYTLPFVLVTWGLYLLITAVGLMPKNPSQATVGAGLSVASAAATGIGQVMFQTNAITGMIFLLGILVNSAKSAFFAIVGSLLGLGVATAAGFEVSFIDAGLFSFNAVLCTIALGKDTKKDFLLAIFASVASVFITFGMMRLNLPSLTFPFVAATWIVLLLTSANFKKKVVS